MTAQEPMSDERLVGTFDGTNMHLYVDGTQIGTELLAEVERLRTENAAMREIVGAVVERAESHIWDHEDYADVCVLCWGHKPDDEDGFLLDDAPIVHTPDCPVTKARTLLNQPPEE